MFAKEFYFILSGVNGPRNLNREIQSPQLFFYFYTKALYVSKFLLVTDSSTVTDVKICLWKFHRPFMRDFREF